MIASFIETVISFRVPTVKVTVGINNSDSEYPWFVSYLSVSAPEEGVDWDTIDVPYDFGWYLLGNVYTSKVIKSYLSIFHNQSI